MGPESFIQAIRCLLTHVFFCPQKFSFHGDLNATYPVGKISEESEHLIKSTRRCLDRAISICRPGTLFREIGNIIEPMAKQAGLNVNKRYCGHGISQLVFVSLLVFFSLFSSGSFLHNGLTLSSLFYLE
jgi:hypothetical protein